jgi:two-component system chemotaxis response regulator CheY
MSAYTVLIVEDDIGIRESLQEALQMDGYSVIAAVHGEDALKYLNTGRVRPSLILLDLMMPVMNGWEFLKTVKANARFSNIPVIVLSAAAKDTGSEDLHAVAFLKKPVDLDTLINLVERYCD